MHDCRECRGGRGIAPGEGGKPVSRSRPARSKASQRTAESLGCIAGGRGVFGEADSPRVSAVGGTIGCPARWPAARGFGDPLARPGGVPADQHWSLWPGAGGVRALHLAHTPLSRPVGASCDQSRGAAKLGIRISLYEDGAADPGRGEFAARAPRRRCSARCHGIFEVSVSAAAHRRDLRCHHLERARIRFIRAVEGNADRRLGAHIANSGRLLAARRRRYGLGWRTHRPALADWGSGQGAIDAGRSYAAPNRLRIGRRGCIQESWHGARTQARRGPRGARPPRWRAKSPGAWRRKTGQPWLNGPATWFTAGMPSTQRWNGLRNGCWKFGWPSRAAMRALKISRLARTWRACMSTWSPRTYWPNWSAMWFTRERRRRCGL